MPTLLPYPPTEAQSFTELPAWPKRARLITGVCIALTIVCAVGILWTAWQKPTLIGDYRSGYAQGAVDSARGVEGNCQAEAAQQYSQQSQHKTAYVSGCLDAVAGRSSAWWHLRDRLDPDAID